MSTLAEPETPITPCPGCGIKSSEDFGGEGYCWTCWTARTDPEPASPERLRFMTAAQLKAQTPESPPWIVDGYLFRGGLTLLGGKPKAGKSTLALDLAAAIARGDHDFLGRSLASGPVIYVSEEGAATLVHKLPDTDRIRVLTRENAHPKPDWPTLIKAATVEAKEAGAELLVVDTLAYWAALPPEREKDTGAALQVMEVCLDATRAGLAVLLPAHTRKGGGEDGEGIRGSSAFAGSADIVLELERIPDEPRQRALLALSRFPATPGTLVCELERDGAWRAISEDADRGSTRTIVARQRTAADREAILSALDGAQLTRAELEDATGAPSRQWHTTLEALVKDEKVTKTGAGRKGNPYRYTVVRTEAAHAAPQDGAESGDAGILFSAHPYRGAETESTAAPQRDAAQRVTECAENGGPPDDWTEDRAQALIDRENEATT